jgi:hypothetical protein
MQKSKDLLNQQNKVNAELVKLLKLSAEHFPEDRGSFVDKDETAFVIIGIQPPTKERDILLSCHVLSPATLPAKEYNATTLADLRGYGLASVIASLFADNFKEHAETIITSGEEVQRIHIEGGHA